MRYTIHIGDSLMSNTIFTRYLCVARDIADRIPARTRIYRDGVKVYDTDWF